MRRFAFAITLILTGCAPAAVPSAPEPLTCAVGPIEKTFGGTRWFVHGCDDRESLAISAAPDNPARPLTFILSEADGRYVVGGDEGGEGPGDLDAALAAQEDIRGLDRPAVEALLKQTDALRRE